MHRLKAAVTQKLESYFLLGHRFPEEQEHLPSLHPQCTVIFGYKPDMNQKTACRHQVAPMSSSSEKCWAFIYTFIPILNKLRAVRVLPQKTRQTISLTIASLFPCFWDFLSWSRWQDKQRELFIPAVSFIQREEKTQRVIFHTSVD